MTSGVMSCYIYSEDDSLPAIYLPDKTEIYVGRSDSTGIRDSMCSRNQVRLYASYEDQRVFVQQVGTRSSGLNKFKTRRGVKLVSRHGDSLHILYGKYKYRIEFNPPPSKEELEKNSKRTIAELDKEDKELYETGEKLSKRFRMGENSELTSMKLSKESVEEKQDINDTVDSEVVNEILSKVDSEQDIQEASHSSCSNMIGVTGGSGESVPEACVTGFWEDIDNKALLIYTSKGVQSRPKIAAYDMDGTLITTRSGLVLPKDCNDWQILYPVVPAKLKKLYADNYKIVIFTNQGQLGAGKLNPSDFKMKIEKVVKRLGVPIQVFVATGKNYYRKPVTGMWHTLVKHKNDSISVNKSQSFYVGDAAGRKKDWAPKKRKDHSSADRLLALNLGLTFHTPEEHFLGQKPAPYELPVFNPKSLKKDVNICDPPDAKITAKEQEVIIMVGGPGSGKSHIAKTYLAGYQHINRDTLRSWQKCVTHMDEALSKGKSVVVDNTNPDPVSREKYIKVAQMHKVPTRCFVMATGLEHSKHNNKFRELTDSKHQTITDIIINSYMKNYKPPSLDEGFSEIVKINFVPQFRTDRDRQLYEMYLLEK
ncbi:uncharacterized protein F21D5.5 isoform X2 [Cephus cinctus]|uniref:Uncharacterized protein F21D5.5 isoform X2 n=1 Tax=Cephus cinctus TaxID=211228 RepID=A0AAJ7C283_CEPCN|nr:uncharacterized protein F21D5.5 isoform X2 [Cephus cinctus]